MYLVLDTLSKRIFAKVSSFKKALKEKEKAALKYNTNPNSIQIVDLGKDPIINKHYKLFYLLA